MENDKAKSVERVVLTLDTYDNLVSELEDLRKQVEEKTIVKYEPNVPGRDLVAVLAFLILLEFAFILYLAFGIQNDVDDVLRNTKRTLWQYEWEIEGFNKDSVYGTHGK